MSKNKNKKSSSGPKMFDINLLIQAGIDPGTGLPLKIGGLDYPLKNNIVRALKVLDEQNAVNRYQWYNIPCNISSQELERMLYYKGQLAFFFNKENKKFYFMPYALDGSIDFYGRFNVIHPIPFAEGEEDKKTIGYQKQAAYLSTLKLKVLYDMPLNDIDVLKPDSKGKFNGYCVLLHDYTKGLAQEIIPRHILQDPFIDIESDMLPYCRTALRNSTGVKGLRVMNEDETINVDNANAQIEAASIRGLKFVPVVGTSEFQDLASDATNKAEEFLMTMQSIDNLRLGLIGLKNGGLFQKKSHVLESEESINSGDVEAVLQDGLSIRQNFCDIVNAVFDCGISCEISDSAVGSDSNMDGMTSDEQDQTGMQQGQQPQPTAMEE